MTDEIVLAFRPSKQLKDYCFRGDGDGHYFYEQRVRFYDPGCNVFEAACPYAPARHDRHVGHEPYFDLDSQQVVDTPRIYVTHHAQKGEWERLKTVDDLLASRLALQEQD